MGRTSTFKKRRHMFRRRHVKARFKSVFNYILVSGYSRYSSLIYTCSWNVYKYPDKWSKRNLHWEQPYTAYSTVHGQPARIILLVRSTSWNGTAVYVYTLWGGGPTLSRVRARTYCSRYELVLECVCVHTDVHTVSVYTQCVHTVCTHAQCVHTVCTHSVYTRTVCTHTHWYGTVPVHVIPAGGTVVV
jgi:hypothetical protein